MSHWLTQTLTVLCVIVSLILTPTDSTAQIKLAWDPVPDADLAGYRVYYGTASRTYGTPIPVGKVMTYTVPGLKQGVTYYFAVTAYDTSDNESGYSNEVFGMVASSTSEGVNAPNVLSGPTSGVTGASYTYSSAGSSSSLGHPVEYQFDWKGDGTLLSPWGPASQSMTWTSPGTYQVRARARCASHASVVSSWVGSLMVTITISQPVFSTTVTTYPTGLQITVDGTAYTAPRTFNWAPGSAHTLSVPPFQMDTEERRFAYRSWSNGGEGTQKITAPSANTTFTATFVTQYRLFTSAMPSEGATVNPSGMNWYDSGQKVSITATPAAGYLFMEWSGDVSGSANPTSIIMDGPKRVTAATWGQTGYLIVVIDPQGAIDAGARLRVNGGPWLDSGYMDPYLPVGDCRIEFSEVPGWRKPFDMTVTIRDREITYISGSYTQ